MTKSVKEKNRLHKIKNHKPCSGNVTPDMIKTRYTYKTYSGQKYLSKFKVNTKTIRNSIDPIIKSIMAPFLINIANKIGVCDFKLSIFFHSFFLDHESSIKNPKFPKVSLTINLFDNLKNSIGMVLIGDEHINGVLDDPDFSKCKKSKRIYKQISIIKQLLIDKQDKVELLFNKTFPNENEQISKATSDFKTHKSKYTTGTKILKMPMMTLLINEEIKYYLQSRIRFSDYSKPIILNIEEYNDIVYIKFLKENGILNIDIDDSKITMENLEEISTLIKMSAY